MRFFVIVFMILLLEAVPVRCKAYDGELVYTIINGRAVITGYTGEPEFIEIPQVIDSCTVTEIARGAFYGCRSLKKAVLPSSIRKIGENSFYACYSLEEAIIPEGVEKLGEGCFCGCTSLSSVSIPLSLTDIPDSCFRACVQLKTVNLPCSIRRIGNYSFSGCTSLEDVTFGDGLSEIGERSFFMCGALQKLYIPSSLTKLGKESVGYAPSNQGASPMHGFELSGRNNSEAERYAEANGISFIPSEDIIRSVYSYHPSHRSQKVSEMCVAAVMLAFMAAALLSVRSAAVHKR